MTADDNQATYLTNRGLLLRFWRFYHWFGLDLGLIIRHYRVECKINGKSAYNIELEKCVYTCSITFIESLYRRSKVQSMMGLVIFVYYQENYL